MKTKRSFVCWITAVVLLASVCAAQDKPVVTRPASENLLPESTVVYIQIRDVPGFIEQMGKTNLGKFLAHEKIAPLVQRLWGSVQDQYEKVRDNVGVSLDQLRTLLTGELCFAVVDFKDRKPGVMLMFDYDPNAETLDTLVQRGEELADGEGQLGEPETEGDVEIRSVKTGDGPDIYYFKNSGTFVGTTDLDLAKEVLRDGEVRKLPRSVLWPRTASSSRS